jgi:hypothetical protein
MFAGVPQRMAAAEAICKLRTVAKTKSATAAKRKATFLPAGNSVTAWVAVRLFLMPVAIWV